MPPEVHYCRPLLPTLAQLPAPASPGSPKHRQGIRRMKISGKKLIPLLLLILVTLSILRLLKIAITTASPSPPLAASSLDFQRRQVPSGIPALAHRIPKAPANASMLTPKEFGLLSNIVTRKAPCNLLVFGFEPQYLNLSLMNAGGITIFLEDDPYKIRKMRTNSSKIRIYKVEYQVPAKKAYKLLKHARQNPACRPSSLQLQNSTCKLALTHLPQEVYELKWDVVVVDGPRGDALEAPGRMGAIYTARMLARAGNSTEVVVHDVDRTIEKWFSWEFLCEENLVSSKGNLWNFRINTQSTSRNFCSAKTASIE